MTEPLRLRAYTDDDLSFILNSWLLSDYRSARFAGMRKTLFFNEREPQLKLIIARAGVLIACSSSSPTTILGWVCAETYKLEGEVEAVIHFGYVKKEFRRFGIGKHLYDEATKLTELLPWSTTQFATVADHVGKCEIVDWNNTDKPKRRMAYRPKVIINQPNRMANTFKHAYNPFLESKLGDIDTKPIVELVK